MNDEEIARLRALCEKATPGPWEKCGCSCGLIWSLECDGVVATAEKSAGDFEYTLKEQRQNAAFIAEARTALPALLDEIERLRFLHNNGQPSFEQVSTLQRHIKETGELVRDLTAKIVFMASALGIPEGVDPSRTNIENAVTRIGNEIARLRGMILDLGLDPDAGAK